MQTSSFRSSSKRAAVGAAYVCLALALSYLEVIIPFDLIVPLPGFKLGLANIVIIFAYYRSSPLEAFAVSLVRVLLSGLLFSGVTTLLYSLSGAVFSFCAILIISLIFKDRVSFIGVSSVCAVFHNMGQLAVAAAVFSFNAVKYLIPYLIICALICGIFTGILLCLIPKKLFLSERN